MKVRVLCMNIYYVINFQFMFTLKYILEIIDSIVSPLKFNAEFKPKAFE